MAGLAAAGAGAAETGEPGSLYIPKPHLVDDRKFLHDFMDEFSFAELVTAAPGIRITHIPVLLDRSAGKYGTLFGHVSRNNPQNKAFDGRQPAVIVFRGPHGYISPTWYAKTDVVPTWNFAVVHAGGKLKAITSRDTLHDLLARLIRKFESAPGYDFLKLPENYKYGLMAGIAGFEMEIESLEGKFKLGQERSDADKESMLRNLPGAKKERTLQEFTSNFYQRKPQAARSAGTRRPRAG
jgi:transcriptional regulator